MSCSTASAWTRASVVTKDDRKRRTLLVNLVDTWKLRPEAVSKIPNLFLASDYVRTYTDLATMEAANEAARRAVNGILTLQVPALHGAVCGNCTSRRFRAVA